MRIHGVGVGETVGSGGTQTLSEVADSQLPNSSQPLTTALYQRVLRTSLKVMLPGNCLVSLLYAL